MVRRVGKYSVAAADLLHRAPHAPLNIRLSITSFLCWIGLEKRYITLSEDHQVSRNLVAGHTSFKTSAFSEALGMRIIKLVGKHFSKATVSCRLFQEDEMIV